MRGIRVAANGIIFTSDFMNIIQLAEIEIGTQQLQSLLAGGYLTSQLGVSWSVF
jgi:hypothetical protein